MAHDEAFLDAIRERPDDDAPRLVYADWLEEHGRPERAEFIRVQCAMEREPSCSPRWYELDERQSALQAEHEWDWLGPLRDVLRSYQFRRGFLDSIALEAPHFLAHGEELFNLEPIRQVSLSEVRHALHALAASPLLDRVISLSLAHNLFGIGTDEVQVLCCSPHLRSLTGLDLSHNHLGTEAVAILRHAPLFARLRSLDLSSNFDIGATAIEYLVDSSGPVHLKDLNVGFNDLGAAGLQALTASPSFYRGLTRLDVSGNNVSAAGIRALAHAKGSLTELRAAHNPLGDYDAVSELASSSAFETLTVLDLSRTHLGSNSSAAVARSSHLRGLTSLYLSGNYIGERGAKELASSPNLTRLELLDLTGDEIGDEGAKALSNSPHLANLRALFLGVNGLRAWGLRELVMSPHLRNLYTLDLHGNNLRDQGTQVIARWSRLPQLTSLALDNNRIGDVGAKELADSPHLPCLRDLDLTNNDITTEGVASLKASRLGERLVSLNLGKNEIPRVVGFLPSSDP